MLIVAHASAQFRNAAGEVLFTVGPDDCNRFIEAPDSIQEDPLFQMMVEDRSLEASLSPAQVKQMEQDPLAGIDASGKRKTVKAEAAETENAGEKAAEEAEKPAKGSRTAGK